MSVAPFSIIRPAEFVFADLGDARVATPVSPETGSDKVTLRYAEIRAAGAWAPPDSNAVENVVVVYRGTGRAALDGQWHDIESGSALLAPTGVSLAFEAGPEGLSVYVWAAPLLTGRRHAAVVEKVSSLWNETTQLVGFAGTGQVAPSSRPATMNFVFWPGTGSGQMCLHCGIQQPGETFNVHLHKESEEAFISFEGEGQMYLADRWIDVEPGTILYCSPGILHGTRNPHEGPDAERFVTCGGPMPFDPFLYEAAGVQTTVAE